MKRDYVKKILLTDDCDETYTDLIIFDYPVLRTDIQNAIIKVKNEKPGEYTNEDIYNELDNLGHYNITFLGDYEIFYY